MGGQCLALSALVVCKKCNARRIDALDQHNTARWPATGIHCAQGHRIGLQHLGLDGFLKPAFELGYRIRGDIGDIQRRLGIFLAKICKPLWIGGGGGHGRGKRV